MMHQIKFKENAFNSLSKLPKNVISQIKNKIIWMSQNTENIIHKKLKGKEFEYLYKLRVGDYRVIYEIDNRNKLLL